MIKNSQYHSKYLTSKFQTPIKYTRANGQGFAAINIFLELKQKSILVPTKYATFASFTGAKEDKFFWGLILKYN